MKKMTVYICALLSFCLLSGCGKSANNISDYDIQDEQNETNDDFFRTQSNEDTSTSFEISEESVNSFDVEWGIPSYLVEIRNYCLIGSKGAYIKREYDGYGNLLYEGCGGLSAENTNILLSDTYTYDFAGDGTILGCTVTRNYSDGTQRIVNYEYEYIKNFEELTINIYELLDGGEKRIYMKEHYENNVHIATSEFVYEPEYRARFYQLDEHENATVLFAFPSIEEYEEFTNPHSNGGFYDCFEETNYIYNEYGRLAQIDDELEFWKHEDNKFYKYSEEKTRYRVYQTETTNGYIEDYYQLSEEGEEILFTSVEYTYY